MNKYWPIFNQSNYDFIGIFKCDFLYKIERIKIPCFFSHSNEDINKYNSLMNEIENSIIEKRISALTEEDQKFIDHYQSFYIDFKHIWENHKNSDAMSISTVGMIGTIDLTPYSEKNQNEIKEYLSFKSNYFDDNDDKNV